MAHSQCILHLYIAVVGHILLSSLKSFFSKEFYTGCNRRYYHNYYVHKQSSLRTYYGGVPHVIQVAQHFFMESPLLELFSNGMVFGW